MNKINHPSRRLPLHFSLFLSVLTVLFSFFFSSCKSGKTGRSGPLHVKVTFNEQISLEEIEKDVSSFEIVPIAYSPGNEMGPISKISGTKDRIVLYSRKSKTIWVLDYNGEILNKINKEGKGPGEYGMLSEITINPEGKLVIIDPYKSALMEYLPDGSFVREIKLPGNYEIAVYLDRKSLVLGSYRILVNEQVPGYYLRIFSPDLTPEKQMLPFYTSWPNGGIRPDLILWDNKIGISKVGDYNYYMLDKDRNLDTLLVFDFGVNGYDFSKSDRMKTEDFIQIFGQNLKKPISAGLILPQLHKYLSVSVFYKGLPFFGVGAWDQSFLVCRPILDFKIIGTYKGFPVPNAREMVNGRIAGSLEAIDILDFWEKYPDQKSRAEKEPEFKKIISQLDAEDNPVLFFFTLGK